jgi:nucleoside-diphosphate kinase
MERTLILVKPDAFARNLTGEIIARFERKGLRLATLKQMTMAKDMAETHYAEHREKPFFGELVEFITSGPTWALVVEGEGAIATMRTTIGATDPANAAPGTIRGDLASSARRIRSRPRPARFAGTSRSRSARTWSTARIRPSRRRARSGCSSLSCSAFRRREALSEEPRRWRR